MTKSQLNYFKYGKDYYENNKERFLLKSKKRYDENRESIIKHRKQKHKDPLNYTKIIHDRCRQRARKRNIPFNISPDDIIIPENCPVFGFPLKRNLGGKCPTKNSPSVDRIIPELGYIKGNIQVISYLANIMKNNANLKELILFSKWIINTYSNHINPS